MTCIVSPNSPFGVTLTPEPGGTGTEVTGLSADRLRALVREHHLVLLRGFTGITDAGALVDFAGALGELVEWPFGYVLELLEKDDPQDHIFDHTYMPMHWDGMYMPFVPEFQVFHCPVAPPPGDGGETTFSDTSLLLRGTDKSTVDNWRKVTGTYRRRMEFYDSVTVAPLVTGHPVTGEPVLRYNELTDPADETFVNHPDLEFSGLPAAELERVHAEVTKALYSPANFYAHRWQTGDLVLTDNFTLLHARNAFTARAPRHLRRVHVLGIENPHLVRA